MNVATPIDALLASQRVAGEGRIAVARDGGRTRLRTLYQAGAAKIRLPRAEAGPLAAVLINTAGGLTGGDRLAWNLEVGAGAGLVATTQACEKIYRSSAGDAEATARIVVGPGGRVAWLPQETILFDRSRLRRRLDVDLAEGAEALVLESVVFVRRAMRETADDAHFRERWRLRVAGRLVHAEDFAIGPPVAGMLAKASVARGGAAVATLLFVGEAAGAHLDAARAILGEEGGASFWRVGKSGKLLARLIAGDDYRLRKRLVPLVELLNGRAGLPKLWST